MSQVLFQIVKMPNRSCDFCGNCYKSNQSVGYYKVTEKLRKVLGLDKLEDSNFDFICGEHFSEGCFGDNGRLNQGAIPTLFPYRECLNHDHTYIKTEYEVGKDTGTSLFYMIYHRI
jgi:hypothetical protein